MEGGGGLEGAWPPAISACTVTSALAPPQYVYAHVHVHVFSSLCASSRLSSNSFVERVTPLLINTAFCKGLKIFTSQ